MNKRILAFSFIFCILVICTGSDQNDRFLREPAFPHLTEDNLVLAVENPYEAAIDLALQQLEAVDTSRPVDDTFLLWACENISQDFAAKLSDCLAQEAASGDPFYAVSGSTLHVLWDHYTNAVEDDPYIHQTGATGTVTLAFTGDINLADDWENMLVYSSLPGGIESVISPPLLDRMRNADILLVNNEFCFSDRGSPMADKLYTFRAATENIQLLREMGVDIVSLANNHVYDYGTDSFLDTLETLSAAGIPYIGAGRDLDEAMQVQYFHGGGMKIAYVAASRAEKYILTPQATSHSPGVLWCYEDQDLLRAVSAARQNADWVIAYLHWGTENTTILEEVQISLAHSLVDNGADIVIGAHPHVLQGIEFYQDCPIVYSLGNFWFNTGWVDTALLEINLLGPADYQMQVQPCLQAWGTVCLLEEEHDRLALFHLLESISENIAIDDAGFVFPSADI